MTALSPPHAPVTVANSTWSVQPWADALNSSSARAKHPSSCWSTSILCSTVVLTDVNATLASEVARLPVTVSADTVQEGAAQPQVPYPAPVSRHVRCPVPPSAHVQVPMVPGAQTFKAHRQES